MTPELYTDIFDRFQQDSVRYVVISGAAVVLHGFARPIADLDIVVDPAPAEADRAMMSLMNVGFFSSIPLPLSMVSVLRMFDSLSREVDVFVRYRLPFEDLWTNSVLMTVGSSVARVASLDDLLTAKRLVGRPHDLSDVEGLMAIDDDS